jgi:glycine oxidase
MRGAFPFFAGFNFIIKMKFDYIIVGRGIAGTMLSYFLLKENKKVLVIDTPGSSTSTYVAPGVLNPITGRRMVKSWMVDTLLPFAVQTYSALEELVDKKIFYPRNLLRFFPTLVEKGDALKKKNDPQTSAYIEKIYDELIIKGITESAEGGCEITASGYVDTVVLLKYFGEYLKKNGALTEENFDYSDLEIIDDKTIRWKDIEAGKIIFCEGYKVISNPFFGHLPLAPTKGELLTIHAPELETDKIINKGIAIIPVGNNIFKVGATNEWAYETEGITEKNREELVSKLNKIITVPYQILQQQAGIRPTVKDRRPLIGLHPEHKNIGLFNGLGTKGMMLAPYLAKHFVDVLEKGEELMKEVDIMRFWDEKHN